MDQLKTILSYKLLFAWSQIKPFSKEVSMASGLSMKTQKEMNTSTLL